MYNLIIIIRIKGKNSGFIMQEKDIDNAKKDLANLYLILKSGNTNEVIDKIFNFIRKKIKLKKRKK